MSRLLCRYVPVGRPFVFALQGAALQQPHHPFQASLHRGHLFRREACERAVAEAVPVEGAGLVDDYLTRLEQPVSGGISMTPDLDRNVWE